MRAYTRIICVALADVIMVDRSRMTFKAGNSPKTSRCHCNALRRTTRTLTHFYDAGLAPAGLTTPQFGLLRTIEALGPASISTIARRLMLDRTTLGRNLRPMIKAAFVVLVADERDARERQVVLTEMGRLTIRRAAPLWIDTQRRLAARVGREKLDQLHALLGELETAARDPSLRT
jgi:DNA-binding MarR family transcriptional regulator